MSNPRRNYNSAAPRPLLSDQAQQILEQAQAQDPEAVPALEEHLDRQVFEGRRSGQEFLSPVDLNALPGTTLGEELGAGMQNAFSPELAQQIEAYLASREQASRARAHEAAQTGENLVAMEVRLRTEEMISQERRYGVMVEPKEEGEIAIRATINMVRFTIPVGVWVDLPYSLLSLMVDVGRCKPPKECPELMASAINAGTLQAVSNAALANRTGGLYHGDQADAGRARGLDATVAERLRSQILMGQALPANLSQFQAPPILSMNGRAL